MNNKEISYIKTTIFGKFRIIPLEECLKKLFNYIYELEILNTDIKYTVIDGNNKREKDSEEKLIIVGLKERLILWKDKNLKEFFIDITLRIIPKSYRPYKAMTIAAVDNKNSRTLLICLAFIKYMDSFTYRKVFQYWNENFSFNPINYENALSIAIKESKFFKNQIIHVRCLFHFFKSIREKIQKVGLSKKKLNKQTFELLKNIEIICFLDISRRLSKIFKKIFK